MTEKTTISVKLETQVQFNETFDDDYSCIIECVPYWVTVGEPEDGDQGFGYYIGEIFAPIDAPRRKIKVTTEVEVIE